MELFLIRHAESTGNQHNIMQGQWEYPLSEAGLKQAGILSRYLTTFFASERPGGFYVSPLARALQTAEPIGHSLQADFEVNDLLMEADCGIFSGLTWEEAGTRFPDVRDHFKQVRDWSAVPEGESRTQIWQRARLFLEFLQTRHTVGERILVVSHGGFIRAVLGVLAGIPPEQNLFITIDNTSLSVAGIRGTRCYIRYVNNTAHLNGCSFAAESVPL